MKKVTMPKKIKQMPDLELETYYREKGEIVAGVDEAGRGCIAGPVVAAAVILPDMDLSELGINDSKQLSPKKRDELFEFITANFPNRAACFIDHETIDDINILGATMQAMRESVEQLRDTPGRLLIDGNYFRGFGIPYITVKKGDSKSLSIAAASIVAKVSRDRWMETEAEKLYPGYGFASHKGYGTKKHYEAIDKLGLCPIHRRSFMKKYFDRDLTLF